MSKALKKLIDINRLREFKNKLVGAGSAYVQTAAVDQTIAGTKTFSKPIVGSVTGSSGSCTGNATSATKLQTARTINGTSFNGTANITTANWGTARNISITDGTNTGTAVSVNGSANVSLKLPATIEANLTGNSDTATKATQDSAGQQIDTTYIKGLAVSGRTITYTKGDGTTGTITTQDTNTDTKVTQTVTTTNTEYPVLFSADANKTATSTTTVRFSSNIKINPSTNTITATTFKGNLTGNVTGNALTATTAATATNATYANWLRTSSHSDHLFHTEWDNAGYFWTYVTAGNGEYRAVRVARSDSAATAQACTGNAATATKLDTARTIALSGAATGTATAFDGSGNITIPVTALAASSIRAQWYAAYPDGAEAHNAMWGGRDITAAFNNGTVSANIANGTFKDIFPGDYITKQVTIPRVLADDGTTELFAGGTYTVNWVIADCDYWINKGDQGNGMETHHVVIVPQAPIFNANMNATNTTEGGYKGSEMYKNVIPACATGIVNAFGGEHILTFRDHLTRDMNTSAVSSGITVLTGAPNWNGVWHSQQCNLMSEAMVYDGPHCASSALDNIMATRQMSAFRLSEKLINYNRQWWWLRDVVSSALFAFVYGGGGALAGNASAVYGVRPFALLR